MPDEHTPEVGGDTALKGRNQPCNSGHGASVGVYLFARLLLSVGESGSSYRRGAERIPDGCGNGVREDTNRGASGREGRKPRESTPFRPGCCEDATLVVRGHPSSRQDQAESR